MKNIYLIVGKSGVGKSTLANKLAENYGYKVLSSYTTRPRRSQDETGHIFVTDDEFDNLGELAAYTEFDGYRYGVTKELLEKSDLYVVDLAGCHDVLEHNDGTKGVVIIELRASENELRCRMRKRGDSPEQIRRRLLHDRQAFDMSCDPIRFDFQVHADGIEETASAVAEYIAYREKYDAAVRIFQINTARDINRVKFIDLFSLDPMSKSTTIDFSIYDPVWEGTMTVTALDDVYSLFNQADRPRANGMHSLSVSDIVEVRNAFSDDLNGYWFCNNIGWMQLTDELWKNGQPAEKD